MDRLPNRQSAGHIDLASLSLSQPSPGAAQIAAAAAAAGACMGSHVHTCTGQERGEDMGSHVHRTGEGRGHGLTRAQGRRGARTSDVSRGVSRESVFHKIGSQERAVLCGFVGLSGPGIVIRLVPLALVTIENRCDASMRPYLCSLKKCIWCDARDTCKCYVWKILIGGQYWFDCTSAVW